VPFREAYWEIANFLEDRRGVSLLLKEKEKKNLRVLCLRFFQKNGSLQPSLQFGAPWRPQVEESKTRFSEEGSIKDNSFPEVGPKIQRFT